MVNCVHFFEVGNDNGSFDAHGVSRLVVVDRKERIGLPIVTDTGTK